MQIALKEGVLSEKYSQFSEKLFSSFFQISRKLFIFLYFIDKHDPSNNEREIPIVPTLDTQYPVYNRKIVVNHH